MIVWLIIAALLSMGACFLIARSRGADSWYWLLMGLLLGPLAIPFAFFSKPKIDPTQAHSE